MELFESIADRRILEARAAGLFDDLPGAGKPLPDLHQERESGWWAGRAIALERDKVRYEDLADRIRVETAQLWRLDSEDDLRGRVDALNRLLADYNRTTSFVEHQLLESATVTLRWRAVHRLDRSR